LEAIHQNKHTNKGIATVENLGKRWFHTIRKQPDVDIGVDEIQLLLHILWMDLKKGHRGFNFNKQAKVRMENSPLPDLQTFIEHN
jgi:hypothetical protein